MVPDRLWIRRSACRLSQVRSWSESARHHAVEDGLNGFAVRIAAVNIPHAQQLSSAIQSLGQVTARVQFSEYAVMAQQTAQIIVLCLLTKFEPFGFHIIVV